MSASNAERPINHQEKNAASASSLYASAGALRIAQISRPVVGKWVFQKMLPREFGSAKINVTARSDMRLLAPGFGRSASDLLQVAAMYVKTGSCVWDIGSNLGIFAFCASWKTGSGGSVYTLEADPFYVELQNKTARSLPAGYAPVHPLCAAAADKIGILDLSIPTKGHSRNHLAVVEGNDAGEIEAKKQVMSVTADFLLEHWPKPDFVKVDIEGAEILFLQGASELLECARPKIYIEVNEQHSDLVTQILSSFRYRIFTLSPDGSEHEAEKCTFNSIAKPSELS